MNSQTDYKNKNIRSALATDYTKDGIDHINIWFKARTELGRELSHFYYMPFKHPYYGPFNCMEGFWYYIKSVQRDDSLRTLSGYQAKEHGRTLTRRWVDNFKAIIIEANYHKIIQNEDLERKVIESTLPFDHYYLYGDGNIIIRPKGNEWLVEGFEEIRTMIKEGRAPEKIEYEKQDKKE
jgi:hypothetical protein